MALTASSFQRPRPVQLQDRDEKKKLRREAALIHIKPRALFSPYIASPLSAAENP
jgi:hypothetical protein